MVIHEPLLAYVCPQGSSVVFTGSGHPPAGRSPAARKAAAEQEVDANRAAFQALLSRTRFKDLSDEVRSIARLKDSIVGSNHVRVEWLLGAASRITDGFQREMRRFTTLPLSDGVLLLKANTYWSLVGSSLERIVRSSPSTCTADFVSAFTASHLASDDSQAVAADIMNQSLRALYGPNAPAGALAPPGPGNNPGGGRLAQGQHQGGLGGRANGARGQQGRGRGGQPPAAAADLAAQRCHRCQKLGHKQQRCPNPLVCSICRDAHHFSECPEN